MGRILCLIRSMFQPDLFPVHTLEARPAMTNMVDVVQVIAQHSNRPRYTFMVLDLIARVARPNGEAGPVVRDGTALVPIREWLAAAIAPSSGRHHQRRAVEDRIRRTLSEQGSLPKDPQAAARVIGDLVQERVRETGMTAISRAVSELVAAGLIRRHYQGKIVDHENRGAQRHAVYTVTDAVRSALSGSVPISEHRREVYIRGAHGRPPHQKG